MMGTTTSLSAREPTPALAIAAAIGFVVSLVTILGAWGFELIGGYVPCPLCLTQRIPYYVAVPVALFAVAAARPHPAVGRALLGLFGLVMLVSAGLGAYHAGVEWGFWPGPSSCAVAAADTLSVEDLQAGIADTRVVPCDAVQWRFAGLSFAGWNALISLGLATIALGATLRAQGSSSVSQ